jgi:acyl carrier protein
MTVNEILKKLTKRICEVGCILDPDQVTPETKLSDLGLDSLDLSELACVIECDFTISFDPSLFKQLTTVGEVVTQIQFQKHDE